MSPPLELRPQRSFRSRADAAGIGCAIGFEALSKGWSPIGRAPSPTRSRRVRDGWVEFGGDAGEVRDRLRTDRLGTARRDPAVGRDQSARTSRGSCSMAAARRGCRCRFVRGRLNLVGERSFSKASSCPSSGAGGSTSWTSRRRRSIWSTTSCCRLASCSPIRSAAPGTGGVVVEPLRRRARVGDDRPRRRRGGRLSWIRRLRHRQLRAANPAPRSPSGVEDLS